MLRSAALAAMLSSNVLTPAVRGDAFDRYTNPILVKVPTGEGAKEVKQLTVDLLSDNDQVLPQTTGAMVVVRTNEGRWSKLLVVPARQKVDEKRQVPILLVERFVTYKEGEERAVHARGQNLHLYNGFHLNLDLGQVVPAVLGGDLRFVAEAGKVYAEPLGKAKLYILTKPLPEAAAKKPDKLEIGAAFEPRYFNGTYQLYDDGRRSGRLTLKVADSGDVSGAYYSDKDGHKYEVKGKIGSPAHSVQFTIKFPQSEQAFHGWLFTGNGKAITGTSRLQERESGFYAVRTEDE